MARLKLSSIFSSSSTPVTSDGERKKENRRSFPALTSFRSRDSEAKVETKSQSKTNGVTVAVEPAPEEPKAQPSPEKAGGTSLTALAKKIAEKAEELENYMTENGLPMPSFDSGPAADLTKLPDDIQKSRQEIVSLAADLRDLVKGPRECLRWMAWDFLNVLSLQAVNYYGFAKLFPPDGTITLQELQAKSPLDAVNTARFIRHAMTNHIFAEPSPGVIAHTAASRLLAEDAELQAWISFNSEEGFPSAARTLDALRAYPEATSMVRTGFNFAFDTVDKEPMFVTFGKDPMRARRMGAAMASLTGGEGYEVSYLVDNYDFGNVDAKAGTLVDIGGSHGFVCVHLAKKYRNMKFIVQDLPKTVESAPSPISDDVQVGERISFMAHDFFTEQPVKDADVYFFRWIMHNYSTPYALKILKNLIPALKPGARIVINDHCLRTPGQENPWDERLMRGMDLVMLMVLNAQERDEAEFRALFAAADSRFVFKGVTRPAGCRMSIIEAVWQPDHVPAEAADDK